MSEKLGALFGKPEDARTYRTEKSSWVLPNQNIGVEVEVENVKQDVESMAERRDLLKLWDIHPDGSLRDHGLEFTTHGPLFGDDLDGAIDNLITLAHKMKWKGSERTGIHIHMDMRDCDQTELILLSCLYSICEKPLFHWIGEHRLENIYCLPWFRAQDNLKYVAALGQVQGEGVPDIVGKLQRYSALNLASLGKYATVEFRHMDTRLDTQRIKSWINLLMCMKKYARDFYKDHDNAQQLLATFSGLGPKGFAEAVFEKHLPSLDYEGMEQDLWDGLLIAQDLAVLYKKKFIAMSPVYELWGEAKNEGYMEYFKNKPKVEPAPLPVEENWPEAPPIDNRTGRYWRLFVPPVPGRITTFRLPQGYMWYRHEDVDEDTLSQGWAIYRGTHLNGARVWWWEGNLEPRT